MRNTAGMIVDNSLTESKFIPWKIF